MATTGLIRVLVVDDSAFVRKVLKHMLTRSPFIEVVGVARDGIEALEQTAKLRPDVITLDLVMPGMDGVTFLRQQMAIRPLPVVVCSITHESGVAALEALEAGAVEFVQKPTALATDRVYEIADELIAKVKAAASVSLAHVVPQSTPQPLKPSSAKTPKPSSAKGRVEIVVIGISTGGPQALRFMIPQLPADFPVPIAMVLHMPIGYTEMYARRLDEIAALHVVEAVEGELVRPGRAFLAPAGRHLTFARESDGSVRTRLDLAPGDTPHRPAADVLFRSAAAIFGSQVLGVVMTGMGTDGLAGAMAIKAAGGRILTEAESSCVVYGMPRAVAEARLSDRVATLEEMSTSIADMV